MNDKIKLKKYFIKDEELTSTEEDKLNAKDVAKNISLVIDNTKPPFAIAVTGQSGIGKSSAINMVAEMYEDRVDEYNFQKVNVWKEEASLKDILETTCVTRQRNNERVSSEYNNIEYENSGEDDKHNEDIVNDANDEGNDNSNVINSASGINVDGRVNDKSNKKKKNPILRTISTIVRLILTFVVCFIITTMIFIFMEYLQNTEIYNANDIFFVENTYLNYRENFLMILIFSFGLTAIAYIVNTLKVAAKRLKEENSEKNATRQNNNENKATVTTEVEDADDIAEIIVEDIYSDDDSIEEYVKNVIIVEDIDKLTVSKMLKTLEEIKYCTEYENCIFIVPFDERVLARAINARNQLKISANYRPLKFEKVVDKIFEFKVYMPHISNGNIKDYAVNLVEETIPNFTTEYCNMKVFEKVIRNILTYKNVTTPRHVKKLINNFINNKVLITQRLKTGKIDRHYTYNRNFDLQLAKLSVIQADFEEFYDVLFSNPDYLEILTELYCKDSAELKDIYDGIDDELKPFFTNKYKPLVNFLRQTKNCKIENVSTLMYLTKVKTEKMFKDKSMLSYILGNEDISELSIQEVWELVSELDRKEDLREFANNNFAQMLSNYELNASDKTYFVNFSKIVNKMYDYIDEPSYIRYLEIAAENYNCYPQEALDVFENLKIDIPVSVMNILIERMKENLSEDNYDEIFGFLRDNSDSFYEENGNLSAYVQFLVDYIGLSSNPTEVIVELDENFTRIGKVYELNRNIKGLTNLDYNVAYAFLAKCLDNGDLDRMVTVINTILSDDDSVQDCLNIEEKMNNYNLVDVVECDVDDIVSAEKEETEQEKTNPEKVDSDKTENSGSDGDSSLPTDDEELRASSIENAKLLNGNYTLLKNIIEICAVKQENVNPTDAMKIIEKALENIEDEEYILQIYELLNKFDRMYFYEIRRNFNEVIYASFHTAKNNTIRKISLECTRYFKNTRLFLTKLTKDEKKFYDEN